MSPRRNNGKRNEYQSVSPVQEDPLNDHVSHAKFKAVFMALAHSIAAQNNQQVIAPANPVVNTAAARIRDFTQMNPPLFSGSKFKEDPQEFLDVVLNGYHS